MNVQNIKPTNRAVAKLIGMSVDTIGDRKKDPPIDMDYQKARAEAYPSIEVQLDMLWHAMDDGQIPKAEPFYSSLKAVKLAYPSDDSVVPGSVAIIPVVT